MTNELVKWPAGGRAGRDARSGLGARVAYAAGRLAMMLALAVGVALAVVFAATLVVILALAIALLGLTALAWRVRPRPVTLRTQPVGHAWVAYRCERR